MKRLCILVATTFCAFYGWGQRLVKDICIGEGNSNPSNFVRVGSRTFFIANDGLHGYELWVTDGTEAGTSMVKDINPGPADACLYHGHLYQKSAMLQALGNRVYFFADDGVHGYELWSSDGTELGTQMIKDIMPGEVSSSTNLALVSNGTYLLFAATDKAHGTELWRSNGTESGTVLVKDILPGPQHGNPLYLFADSNIVYFAATDNINGYGLWKTDGTEDGTIFLKNAAPTGDVDDSMPWIKFKGEVYFSGYTVNSGTELWKTNGTVDGTELVKDINPGSADSKPLHFCIAGDHMVFIANSKAFGRELWQSDGTEAGTTIVKDIRPGVKGSEPAYPVTLKGKVYFVASDTAGRTELWVSDLTDTGTHIFLADTGVHKQFKNLFADTGYIYFTSDSSGTGLELWRTNGDTNGTLMMGDLCSGSCSSEPGSFFRSDTTLFFSAYDDTHGRELWSIGANVTFIEDITTEQFRDVYIDPLRKKLNQLRQTGSEVVYIKIFSLGGDELYTQYVADPNQISSDSFKPGIYILRAYDKYDQMVSFVRFVKE